MNLAYCHWKGNHTLVFFWITDKIPDLYQNCIQTGNDRIGHGTGTYIMIKKKEGRNRHRYIKKSETAVHGISDFPFVISAKFYFPGQIKSLSTAWAMICILNRRFLHRRQLRQAVSLSSGKTKRMALTWMSRQPFAW